MISSPFSNGNDRRTALIACVTLGVKTKSSGRTPTNPATAAAASRIRVGPGLQGAGLSPVSSRSMNRDGFRSISSRSACWAAMTRRGTTPTVP